jgi:hypothetical protein
MRALTCRTLVIVAASLLTLPAGWCCMLPAPTAAQGAPADACKSCCGGCPLSKPNCPAPAKGKDRRPPFPFVSCCYLRTGVPPVRSLAHLVTLAILASGPDFIAASAALPNWEEVDGRRPGPSPPLHVLHCVWLC